MSLDVIFHINCSKYTQTLWDNSVKFCGINFDFSIVTTKLNLAFQVGKKLSELIRDSGSQMPGTDQGRWQAELSQVAIELIAVSISISLF